MSTTLTLEHVLRSMKARNWKCAWDPDAETILDAAGVENEIALALLPRRRRTQPFSAVGVWAPAWAIAVIDADLPDDDKIHILRQAVEDARHVDEIVVAIALGGIEALSAYTKTAHVIANVHDEVIVEVRPRRKS